MTSLVLRDTAPAGWDARGGSAYLFTGFAAACAELGYRALYAEDAFDYALVLVRGVPVLGRWTRRAKVFTARRDPDFLRRLSEALAARGVVHIRIGHQQHPWHEAVASAERIQGRATVDHRDRRRAGGSRRVPRGATRCARQPGQGAARSIRRERGALLETGR